jgi:hypothetical protein
LLLLKANKCFLLLRGEREKKTKEKKFTQEANIYKLGQALPVPTQMQTDT